MELAHESILTELKASGKLPSPAGVALSILELARDPDSSTEDIHRVLRSDPSLSGQILKYANSAASGCREEVSNVNDALVRLGMKMVQQLCLGFSVLSSNRSGHCAGFEYPRYWARSLARGVSAQVLSSKIRAANPEEGFTCGLLMDIGGLALASVYPTDYTRVLQEWNQGTAAELSQLESREFSIQRRDVTQALFEDWRLPEHFGAAIPLLDREELPTAPLDRGELSRARLLAYLLTVAELAGDICLASGRQQDRLVLRYLEVGAALKIPEKEWIQTHDLIRDEWKRMGKVLEIQTYEHPDMERLIQRARESAKAGRLDGSAAEDGSSPAAAAPAPAGMAAPAQSGEPAAGLDILVADADPEEQQLLQRYLAEGGHRPTFVVDGHEALELSLKTSPQVILTNRSLPGIDGLEMCRLLRQSVQTQRTYLIVLAGDDDDGSLVEAFDAGIDDYLLRPLNRDVLLARLKAADRVTRLQQQAARDREELRSNLVKLGRLSRQLEKMALEDQLTRLPNRRAGLDRFDQDWSRATRNQSTLMCLLLDIDHFKKVNDTWGHDCGDVVLRHTADAIRGAVRDADTACRYGGEEFLVICPDSDLKMAMKIGDRVRRAVEENHIEHQDFDGNVTVSVGVALRNEGHDSPKDLIKEADLALYAAKENGRNKVCIYSD